MNDIQQKAGIGQRSGRRLLCMVGLLLGTATLASAQQNPIPVNATPAELVGGPWFNTPGKQPITLASRKGKVTVVHFWTFGCINCKHNQPSYARWQKRFEKQDVAIIGVHTPETDSEKVSANVAREIKAKGITYPVLLDQKGVNWNRWKQQFWPTIYLIDKNGRVRYRWEGELEYNHAGGEAILAQKIEALLKESPNTSM